MLLWSAALALLFGSLRPGVVLGGGPEAVLVAGSATVGGHRLAEAGQTASAGPGDVLATGPGGRLTLALGRGRLELREETLVLLERLGPVSVRLLAAGSVAVDGPLTLVTADGVLAAPAGARVEIRAVVAGANPAPAGARPGASLDFRVLRAPSDGAEVTLVHAAGIDRVP